MRRALGVGVLALSPLLMNLLTYRALTIELGHLIGVWGRWRRA